MLDAIHRLLRESSTTGSLLRNTTCKWSLETSSRLKLLICLGGGYIVYFTGSLEWVLDSKDDMQGESITVSLIDEHLMVLAKILTLKFQR